MSALRPCLQNQSNVPRSKLKWHKFIVHKNVFRDSSITHVAMQCCHITQWHDGLKHSGKAGMPFRTTSIYDNPTWRTTRFNSLLPGWILIADGLHLSYQWKSEYITKLYPTFCKTVWVTTNLRCVGYPKKFLSFNSGTAMQSHRPCWTGIKGKVTSFLGESSLWTKPGLAHMNQN